MKSFLTHAFLLITGWISITTSCEALQLNPGTLTRVGETTRVRESKATSPKSITESEIKQLEKTINGLIQQNIPHKYEKDKGWGNQVERWDGLHLQLKNFKLKTKRRKKKVNHGTWKKYSAELVDPKNGLQFTLNSIRRNPKGQTEVDLSVIADLKLFGRISEWVKGVQLVSVSADAIATVQLKLAITLGTRLDFSNLPPDLYLEPVVDQAKLSVHSFRILRVSKVGGELAQQVGRGVKHVLDDKIQEYEAKLVEKLNRSISKKKDDLKVSVADLVDSEWAKLKEYWLPDEDANTSSDPKTIGQPNPESQKSRLKAKPVKRAKPSKKVKTAKMNHAVKPTAGQQAAA